MLTVPPNAAIKAKIPAISRICWDKRRPGEAPERLRFVTFLGTFNFELVVVFIGDCLQNRVPSRSWQSQEGGAVVCFPRDCGEWGKIG